jgi:rare lipoprotein A
MRLGGPPIPYAGGGDGQGLMMANDTRDGWRSAARFLALLVVLAPILAACAAHHGGVHRGIFSSREFGVAVSPRVTTSANPPHGGGRYLVGDAYKVHGEWYTPKANPAGYVVTGTASWYGADFHGRLTANGEIFNANAISGGSPDLPLPSYARVTNLDNGRSLLVRFNDRGPYMSGRVADLSRRAADLLGYSDDGTARVKIQYVGAAPLDGDDTRYLMASLNQAAPVEQGDTRVAMAELPQTRPLVVPQTRPVALFGGLRPALRPAANPRMTEVLSSVNGLFSYSEAQAADIDVTSAHAAVDAMAGQVPSLDGWVATTDDGPRSIRLGLGVYQDAGAARDLAMQFAFLGAVDEDQVTAGSGATATRLTLTHLKPGVTRTDVLDLVHRLGVTDAVLY